MWDDWNEIAQIIVMGLCAILSLPLIVFALWGAIASVQIFGTKLDIYVAQKDLEIAKIEAQMPPKKSCQKG